MARRHSSRGFIGKLLFILVVVACGYALAVSGNLRNPFNALTEITSLVVSGEQSASPDGEFAAMGARPERDMSVDGAGAPPADDFEGGGPDNQTSIQWSEIGGVLFNLWFIAAASAFVMLVGRPLSLLLKPQRRAVKATPRRRVEVVYPVT